MFELTGLMLQQVFHSIRGNDEAARQLAVEIVKKEIEKKIDNIAFVKSKGQLYNSQKEIEFESSQYVRDELHYKDYDTWDNGPIRTIDRASKAFGKAHGLDITIITTYPARHPDTMRICVRGRLKEFSPEVA